MNVIDRYYKRVSDILAEAFSAERDNIEAAAEAIGDRANTRLHIAGPTSTVQPPFPFRISALLTCEVQQVTDQPHHAIGEPMK